jgi:hypothetical protein
MIKRQLAQALRERQGRVAIVPKQILDLLSDDAIIESYIRCPCCDKKQVRKKELDAIIRSAQDADHFVQLCNQLVPAKVKMTHKSPYPK